METESPLIYTGEQFRQWREEHPKVTIAELADKSGCTQSQISNFETEKTDITRKTMSKLLTALYGLKSNGNENHNKG